MTPRPSVCRFAALILFSLTLVVSLSGVGATQDRTLHIFDRQRLTDVYFSEGAAVGDLNSDGAADVVYGPYWFAGPDFNERHEIYPPQPQNRERYADSFFSWTYDFSGDELNDILVAGFPGTPAYVYENPGAEQKKHWKKHEILDWVSNESPQFTNLLGDDRPELICTRDGFFGFATPEGESLLDTWTFHPISEQIAAKRFGHGLGVGDVNGDGRIDILHAKGWFEQPEQNAANTRWRHHQVPFTDSYGGADMFVYDVDGDGDGDVITSLAAHDFGVAWYEQIREGENITFKQHKIVGSHASESRYGILFSEPHAVKLADIDGDGLKDIITGKTFYSHHKQSPLWDAGAVVYCFRLVRNDPGGEQPRVDWVPYLADEEAGIGRQIALGDVNDDGATDIIVGGMKGAHVLTQRRQKVDQAAWAKAQPKVYAGPQRPSVAEAKRTRGPRAPIGAGGVVAKALEGEKLSHRQTAGNARAQPMGNFSADQWSGDSQLWWTGAGPGDKLTIDLSAKKGKVDLELVLTCARDYGAVQLALDGKPLGPPIDLYDPEVVTTGVLTFEDLPAKEAGRQLTVQIVGANSKAAKQYMFGLDYVRLKGEGETFPEPDDGIKPAADGRALNLDFETGTLEDWIASGKAFEGQPVKGDVVSQRRGNMRSAHRGDYWIGGYEKLKDAPQGTLTSRPFKVTQPYASFLVGGGAKAATRVELVRQDTGKPFYQIAGQKDEMLRHVAVDLRAHLNQDIFIRLVDESSAGWGHINFDHFRFHAKRPGRTVTPPLVELVEDEYPHAGLSAEEAAAAMKLPEGFQATACASEPDVQQPIAMAIDDRGRVWIAEAYEYPTRAKDGEGKDRILIFEDTDGDGKFDRRKVFAEGLNLVSGLEVGFGGVWVGAAPYLLFLPDADGDDVPDGPPQILLDGWGYQDTHETLNAFIWGPDGWLYGCHGVFTHSNVGKPGAPEEDRVPLNAGIWRYHPTGHEFEVFAHGTSNPWGVDFNDHGQAFATACVIPHLYHIIQGARYQRQAGQHFNQHTYRDIVTVADHLHYLGATPHSGNNKSDAAGGGHAHAGAMIYLGDAWPKRYRNQIFMNNIHGQRLNMDLLKPHGSGYIGSHGPDFLMTGDKASQILNLRYGPDGQAYMIDWYDMQACHHRKSDVHDRTNGRIYKITYGEPKFVEVNLQEQSDVELAELALHENDWHVRHARRILQERAAEREIDEAARRRLVEIAATHDDDTRRLRAMWGLHVIGEFDESLAEQLLSHDSPYVRGWTLQLLLENAPPSPRVLERMAQMAAVDESPVTRLHLASALGRFPVEQRWSILTPLCRHSEDAADHNLPLMYWYAAEPLAQADPARALAWAMDAGESIPLLREFMLRRIGSSDTSSSLAVLIEGLGGAEKPALQKTFLKAIRQALEGQRQVAAPKEWQNVYHTLQKSEDFEVQLQASALGATFGDPAALTRLREHVTDAQLKTEVRQTALESLLSVKDRAIVPTLIALLKVSELRTTALRGLAQYEDPRVPGAILAVYPQLTLEEKRAALSTLCSRTQYGLALLDAIENKRLSGVDLTADLVRQLQYHNSEAINSRLTKVWGSVRETAEDKKKLIEDYKRLVSAPADEKPDLALGRAIFGKTCQKCHVLFGLGNKVGPDLTGSNRSNLDYLLSNIVDPSAVMAKEYQPLVVVTLDGRVVNGLMKAETDKALTLQTADAVVILPKAEIEDRARSTKSMMPDDQLKQFSKHEVRSLIAYLRGPSQTPMLATKDNVSLLFNGQDLTGWSGDSSLWSVADGEIVGRTSGLDHNEWLVSDMMAEDFRLSFEVKLVGNEGNSGVQFRSRAHNGTVSGYQADIGPGWWGKLYEEHGRRLLWDKSGERHVKQGDWNEYEIIAQGSHIQTYINGQRCVELNDPAGARRGIFALQLHSGGKTEVRFRNFKLEIIDN